MASSNPSSANEKIIARIKTALPHAPSDTATGDVRRVLTYIADQLQPSKLEERDPDYRDADAKGLRETAELHLRPIEKNLTKEPA